MAQRARIPGLGRESADRPDEPAYAGRVEVPEEADGDAAASRAVDARMRVIGCLSWASVLEPRVKVLGRLVVDADEKAVGPFDSCRVLP